MRRKQQTETKTRVIGYVRVSTEEQANSGLSLAAQRERIRQYCDLYGLELVAVYEDAGASAKTLDREGLQSALAAMKSEAAGLIVAKLDRLTRSVVDAGELLETALRGRQLISVGEQIDTATASGRMVYNVLISIAQWEREAISERTKAALAQKKQKGEAAGCAPFGYRKETDKNTGKKILVPDAVEYPTLLRMHKLRSEGMGWQAIANALNAEGLPNRAGKTGAWNRINIRGLLLVSVVY